MSLIRFGINMEKNIWCLKLFVLYLNLPLPHLPHWEFYFTHSDISWPGKHGIQQPGRDNPIRSASIQASSSPIAACFPESGPVGISPNPAIRQTGSSSHVRPKPHYRTSRIASTLALNIANLLTPDSHPGKNWTWHRALNDPWTVEIIRSDLLIPMKTVIGASWKLTRPQLPRRTH